ncbi:ABC transporter ATP-binding protein [Dactylosporangium sucinum]|uniref:Nitrate ABC transporter ATP-binding protein n=1 Tax=Dactylosporangium sucinum TaxID=1424081 RepID=A0A917TUQ5_9ACTN|nr:ABC transporter ATP-binding protein [Dactylosporangium sucinum]GGM38861.1 nitrate ABC transporter ATP-binding protein [Dactylosporangium sucinum]
MKIGIRDLTRTFGRGSRTVEALGPVSLDVAPGEFVSIVGPSGCGKSTLLRAVAGLVRPSGGRINIRVGSPYPVAMIFQDYGIYPWKRVLENVRFGLDVQGVDRRTADARARYWLERMGLADFAGAWPDNLSGGMRQRVSIARAMAAEPEVLLMDEPFAALDAQLRSLLQEELLEICQTEQRTVLFVTHSLSEAILLADRVVVMSARPGRILLDRTVPFDRPRSPEIRLSAEFSALENELWQTLRVEVSGQLRPVPGAPADRRPARTGHATGRDNRGARDGDDN